MSPPKGSIYRFSKRRWLEESLKHGRFRLTPASSYLCLEGDLARYDNELEKTLSYPKESSTVTNLSTGQNIELKSDITQTTSIETDYYVVCFSTVNHHYLFDDFVGSDAYLEVVDFIQFEEMFRKAVEEHLPDWIVWGGAITYGSSSPLGGFFQKDRRFLLQQEWRCVIIPPVAHSKLATRMLDIGSLCDVAKLADNPKKANKSEQATPRKPSD